MGGCSASPPPAWVRSGRCCRSAGPTRGGRSRSSPCASTSCTASSCTGRTSARRRPEPTTSRSRFRRGRVNRERVVRTLTFWLRPEFLLRVVNRFQKVAGFDRSVALASSALTATIPLLIVTSSVASQLGGKGTADRIIDRYGLTGGGAEAVRDIFSSPAGTSTSLGIAGFVFLMIAVLSFSRAVQRLFEQAWELSPLSVRNTFNGLLWIA